MFFKLIFFIFLKASVSTLLLLDDDKWRMGVARPPTNQSAATSVGSFNLSTSSGSDPPTSRHHFHLDPDPDDDDDDGYMPDIRKMISGNGISFDNGIFILVFGFAAIVLVVCCLTARRRRVSTLLVGTVLILNYFSIAFGFVDPHWSQGKPNGVIVTSYCFFHMDSFVQVSCKLTQPNLTSLYLLGPFSHSKK